jgi:hypothetical protein
MSPDLGEGRTHHAFVHMKASACLNHARPIVDER